MSAVRKTAAVKRPPTFHTSEYVDVDVHVDPDDLEAAGWVYVGKDGDVATTETAVDAVRAFHDDEHDTSWRFCQMAPCVSLNREAIQWSR